MTQTQPPGGGDADGGCPLPPRSPCWRWSSPPPCWRRCRSPRTRHAHRWWPAWSAGCRAGRSSGHSHRGRRLERGGHLRDAAPGLPARPRPRPGPGDAWLHPEDRYARERLGSISDSLRSLIWFAEPIGNRHQPSAVARRWHAPGRVRAPAVAPVAPGGVRHGHRSTGRGGVEGRRAVTHPARHRETRRWHLEESAQHGQRARRGGDGGDPRTAPDPPNSPPPPNARAASMGAQQTLEGQRRSTAGPAGLASTGSRSWR